jgi:hypothetical protein
VVGAGNALRRVVELRRQEDLAQFNGPGAALDTG